MACEVKKLDSNCTSLWAIEEACLNEEPIPTDRWFPLEANSYDDFGATLTKTRRELLDCSRQLKKGRTTSIEVAGGANVDLTQATSLKRIARGLLWSAISETPSLHPLALAPISVTGVSATAVAVSSGGTQFSAGDLVALSGFLLPQNNKLAVVATGSTATSIALTAAGLTADAVVQPDANVKLAGKQFDSGDLTIVATGNQIRLLSASSAFPVSLLFAGQWVFVGGDTPVTQFGDSAIGYGRIADLTADTMLLEDCTFEVGTGSGVAKTIQMFWGDAIRNRKAPADQKRFSFAVERVLPSIAETGTQYEYLTGALVNEVTLTLPEADKITWDASFIGVDYKTGTEVDGDRLLGTRVAEAALDAYNSASDLYRIKLSSKDSGQVLAYASEGELTFSNNLEADPALGSLTTFDFTPGDFEVTGSINAYFLNVNFLKAVRNNEDFQLNGIMAFNNQGFLFDIPRMDFDNTPVQVERNTAIKLDLEGTAIESAYGHTVLLQWFDYLPNIAMAN